MLHNHYVPAVAAYPDPDGGPDIPVVMGGAEGPPVLYSDFTERFIGGSWTAFTPLIAPTRTNAGSWATLSDGISYVYSIGGRIPPGDPQRWVQRINTVSGEIALMSDMNHRRVGPKVERITDATGNVYFVSMGGEDGEVVRFAELYDSSNDSWRDLAPMLPRRSGDGAVAYRFPQRDPSAIPAREIYYIGGASLPDASDPTDTFQILTLDDPSDPSDIGNWTQGPSLLTPVRSISAATIGNKVYVVGGWNPKAAYSGDGAALRRVQVYNPDSATWAYSQELPEAVYGHRMLAVNNVDAYGNPAPELHVFGGANNLDVFTNNHFVLPFSCTRF